MTDSNGNAYIEACLRSINERTETIKRLEDRVATLKQETEELREIIITKHEQIAYLEGQSEISETRAGLYEEVHTKLIVTNQRLEARNARLLEALKRLLANIRCECSQFIGGLPPKFGGGRKCDYCNAREAIVEEKEQSK